jgi:glucose-1-phosphate thymidylyltransferase
MDQRESEKGGKVKGIILAGGEGTRLRPCTLVVGKQLLPVFDKPMIYYPLSTLIHAGVDEVLVVTTPHEVERFRTLLSDGKQFGISISYAVQETPGGIPQGILLAEEFLGGDSFWFILGDNLFHGPEFGAKLKEIEFEEGAHIFTYRVKDPSAYGVAVFTSGDEKIQSLIEKPQDAKSKWAIPGIYFLDSSAIKKAKHLRPSFRGELEIIDLLNAYLEENKLQASKVSRGNAWFDLGTAENLLRAAMFVEALQSRQGLLVGSPEEAAFSAGYITALHLETYLVKLGINEYAKQIYSSLSLGQPN